ncbi:hypothetical protein BAUCODRAFT_337720 [Baudoinia panamericana UAMH 10762]|uniref:RING-type domain-containing protein n=1 Tax=Baudoinia panamericana (strain UAMH 10762) TaxID=717646 RepID=M2MRL1_BAUPA|nr:uncharacterized protein BAUCODRAFT_337720 [Baudoinia panamericana UAMH 10762]EMC99466.1 hypothetical protein BAUCODRAFT_337720 [Baudoinia panamericana UAMH 10762]
MGVMIRCQGSTNLRTLTYRYRHPSGKVEATIVIWRCSRIMLSTGVDRIKVSNGTYIMPLEDFKRLDLKQHTWYVDSSDVVHRRSNQAVRHINHQLWCDTDPDHRVQNVEQNWMPKRILPFHQFEDTVGRVVNGEDIVDDVCPLCLETLKDIDEAVLALHCCDHKKMVCRGCFISLADSRGLVDECCPRGLLDACCPFCRHRFFDEATVDALTFGLVGGIYDRSLVGNDRQLALNETKPITVDAELMRKVLKILVEGAMLELATSTPLHMQAIRSTEVKMIVDTFIPHILAEENTRTMGTKALEALVMQRIINEICRRFRVNGVHGYFEPAELHAIDRMLPRERVVALGFRKVMLHFVTRTVSRASKSYHLRRCRKEGCGDGLHKHGERYYYTGIGFKVSLWGVWGGKRRLPAGFEMSDDSDDSDDCKKRNAKGRRTGA